MSKNAETLNRQGSKIIPEMWSVNLNRKLDKSGVGMKIVNHVYEDEIKDFGDTVHIGDIGDITIMDYSEDKDSGGVKYQRVDATSQELKLDQSKSFGVFLSDITQKQSNIKNLEKKFQKRAKIAIDTVKDTYIMASFTDVLAENVKGTDAKPIVLTPKNAYSVFCWLAKTLQNNNAIESENDQISKDNQADGSLPYVVINPDIKSILMQSPDFIHATEAGDKILRKGSIGEIAGLDVLISTNHATVSGKAKILAGINDAIAFAGNVSKIEVLRDQEFFGDNIRGLYVYGKKVVLPKALAGVIVDVSYADNIEEPEATPVV